MGYKLIIPLSAMIIHIFYFLTNDQASNGRVVAIDINKPERDDWQEIIPEQEDSIEFVRKINDHFVVSCLHDVNGKLSIYKIDGSFICEVPLQNHITIQNVTSSENEDEL